jgi:hypothetical protein
LGQDIDQWEAFEHMTTKLQIPLKQGNSCNAEQLLAVLQWHVYCPALSSAISLYVMCMLDLRNACGILAIKLEGKRPICRWESNIKIDVTVIG